MLYIFLLILFNYLATVAFFAIVQRPLFAQYNRGSNVDAQMSIKHLMSATRHGIRTDCIVASYLCALPLLCLWIFFNYPHFNITTVLAVVFAVTGSTASILIVSDTALYDFWHSKIDASVLSYLRDKNDFKGIFDSLSTGYIIAVILSMITLAVLWTLLFRYIAISTLHHFRPCSSVWQYIIGNFLFITILGVFFLIIRGLRIRPNTPSVAHFSPNQFLNHTALNGIYNFIYSLSLGDDYDGKFRFFDDAEAEATVKDLYPRTGTPEIKILNTDRPNILLIVWESLSSRFVEALGGTPGVTPHLNRLCSEGVVFTRCDCSSFLTDRGLAALLTGLPGQPTASIGKHTKKLPGLPGLPKTLATESYETIVVHSGDLNLRQINELFLTNGIQHMIGNTDFMGNGLPTCKWGFHDEVSCNRVYDEIMHLTDEGKRWFITYLTLSSHEPFIVPYNRLENKMENAFAYTDECIGHLIDQLKASPAWKDLLVVIVGDHGVHHSAEVGTPLPRHEYVKIPLLLTGGAVKDHMKIDKIVAQTDIAATLLGQMGLDHTHFPFSRDVLADTYRNEFSFQAFNNGMFVRTPDGHTEYDNTAGKAIDGPDPTREDQARKVLQMLYKYIADL